MGKGASEPDNDPSPPSNPVFAAETAEAEWEDLQRELNRLQRAIRLAIQAKLAKFAGRSLGNLEANQSLAKSIHRMLESHGLRVRCNECGHPAILRVSPRNGCSAGAFVFDHSIGGRRTFHGGSGVMPPLQLVAKPPRREGGRAVG